MEMILDELSVDFGGTWFSKNRPLAAATNGWFNGHVFHGGHSLGDVPTTGEAENLGGSTLGIG